MSAYNFKALVRNVFQRENEKLSSNTYYMPIQNLQMRNV